MYILNSTSASNSASFWRSLQTLNISRVVVAVVLLTYLSLRSGSQFWDPESTLMRLSAIAYVLLAIAFVVIKIYYHKRFMLQLTAQIVLDVALISCMYAASGGGRSGMAILYLFPLAGIGILAPLIWALFFASMVSLFLLIDASYHVLKLEEGMAISLAGLYGVAYFSVVYVLNRLAANLILQEELAMLRGSELAVQQAINRIVIADMGDGILVVDQNEELCEMNPAAQRMLGLEQELQLKK